MLDRMISLASKAHEGQFDKGGKPYILHPLSVMFMLNSDDEELNCIAVGHDLLEDTTVTISELRIKFSERVVQGILALTKIPGEEYCDYLDRVALNSDAIRVKLCDLRHNSDLRRTYKPERLLKYGKAYSFLQGKLSEFNS